MRGSKRTAPPDLPVLGAHDRKKGPFQPLREGFAIPRRDAQPSAKVEERPSSGGGPKPYGRGSAETALACITDPRSCSSALRADISAATTKGPTASRKQLWAALATKAGYEDPFYLEPDRIFEVMGALKLAGFRSAQLYLDTAKSQHIAAGYGWTSQLQQAYRAAVRSCNRNLGNPKQAAPLPLAELASLQGEEPLARSGPKWPARSALLASWWLLREIEASNSIRGHITVHEEDKKIDWRLPNSKKPIGERWEPPGATPALVSSLRLHSVPTTTWWTIWPGWARTRPHRFSQPPMEIPRLKPGGLTHLRSWARSSSCHAPSLPQWGQMLHRAHSSSIWSSTPGSKSGRTLENPAVWALGQPSLPAVHQRCTSETAGQVSIGDIGSLVAVYGKGSAPGLDAQGTNGVGNNAGMPDPGHARGLRSINWGLGASQDHGPHRHQPQRRKDPSVISVRR